jgi:hypothetical protein
MSRTSPASQVFSGWRVALAAVALLSSRTRFTAGPFLKPAVSGLGLGRGSFSAVIALALLPHGAFDATWGCGAAFAAGCALLVLAAGLGVTIRVATRLLTRPMPAPLPAGGT